MSARETPSGKILAKLASAFMRQICSRKDGQVSCTCAPGAEPSAQGMHCEVVSGCGADGSGCDPLTKCVLSAANQSTCTPCPASYVGAVYMFAAQGSEYVQSSYFKAFNADGDDNYGHSVAATESFVAVGGPFESGGQRGVSGQDQANASDNSANASGAVYVYR